MYTLTKEQLGELTNAMCGITVVIRTIENVVSDAIVNELRKRQDAILTTLSPFLEAEEAEEDKREAHYESVREEHGFKTIWSDFSVQDVYTEHPYTDCTDVVCESWTKGAIVPIKGKRWVDLWIAADKAIKMADDMGHPFIEGFTRQDNGMLKLVTGS